MIDERWRVGGYAMKFLVESMFKGAPTPEMLALIPAEVARGKELDAQGKRLMLYVAADQSRAWQVFQGESLEDVQMAIRSLPLHPYVDAKITVLAENM
jgi:muconolactone delta-isomerase